MTTSPPQASPPADAPPFVVHKTRALFFAVLGAAVGSVATFLWSRDWACSAVGAGILAGVAVAVCNEVAIPLLVRRERHPTLVRLVVALTIGSGVVPIFRVNEKEAFREAFGIDPPAGVRDLAIERHYAGGPGDSVVLVRFVADAQTIDQLVAAQSLIRDDETIRWQIEDGRGWPAVWDSTFGGYAHYGGQAWKPPAPVSRPALYRSSGGGEHRLESTKLLWDADSGNAYAIHTVG